jgi:hypothetical protein
MFKYFRQKLGKYSHDGYYAPVAASRQCNAQSFPDTAGPILARLLFAHDQRTVAPNVLRRSAAGWDGCCAERGEAAVGVVKTRLEFAVPRVGVPQSDSAERTRSLGVASSSITSV